MEAMQLYCKAVEQDNPQWWELLTFDLDMAGKRVLLATAKECALEYYEAIEAGSLVPPKSGEKTFGARGRRTANLTNLDDVDASIAALRAELAEREESEARGRGRGSDYLEQLRSERRVARAARRDKQGDAKPTEKKPDGSPAEKNTGGSPASEKDTERSPRQSAGSTANGRMEGDEAPSPKPAPPPPPPADGGESFSLTDLRSRIDALADLRTGGTGIVSPKVSSGGGGDTTVVTVADNADPSYAGMLHKLRFVMNENAGGGSEPGAEDTAAAAAAAAGLNAPAASPLDEVTAMLTWTAPVVHGPRPVPRYQHCAWRDGVNLWVTHGSMNGRKLTGDPRVLDLTTLTWSSREASEERGDDEDVSEGSAAISGAATVIAHNGAVYVFGGEERQAAVKNQSAALFSVMPVRCLDLTEDPGPDSAASMEWMNVSAAVPDEPYEGEDGDAAASAGPCPRAHHTATAIGGEIFIFGGMTPGTGAEAEAYLGDLWAYDVEEEEWRLAEHTVPSGDGDDGMDGLAVAKPPTPRAGHTATSVANRFLLVWGGGAGHVLADRDLHVYDTVTRRWVKPMVTGLPPKARSDHAGCVIGTHWYVAGGGDTREARPETCRLETKDAAAGLYHWSVVNPGTDSQAEAVGKEGLSLVGFRGRSGDFLVAFGGSDGKCRDALYVMRLSNSEVTDS